MPRFKTCKHKSKIYKVVAALIVQKEYGRTSKQEITREPGMSISYSSYYFKSKEELLSDLMNDAGDKLLAEIEDVCESRLSLVEKMNEAIRFCTTSGVSSQRESTLPCGDSI